MSEQLMIVIGVLAIAANVAYIVWLAVRIYRLRREKVASGVVPAGQCEVAASMGVPASPGDAARVEDLGDAVNDLRISHGSIRFVIKDRREPVLGASPALAGAGAPHWPVPSGEVRREVRLPRSSNIGGLREKSILDGAAEARSITDYGTDWKKAAKRASSKDVLAFGAERNM